MSWRTILGAVDPGRTVATHYPQYPQNSTVPTKNRNIANNADIADGKSISELPHDPVTAADLLDRYEERAAIMEFEGGLSRQDAEARAWAEVYGGG